MKFYPLVLQNAYRVQLNLANEIRYEIIHILYLLGCINIYQGLVLKVQLV